MSGESAGARVPGAETAHRLPAFWYEDGHIAHRLPDGTVEHIGFGCWHPPHTDPPRVRS